MTATVWSRARETGVGCLTAVGLRMLIVGCLLVSATTVLSAWRNLSFVLGGVVVEGVVVRQAEELTADWDDPPAAPRTSGLQTAPARRLFRAIVEFSAGGKPYLVEAQARGPVPVYPLRSRVEVTYPPGRPDHARLRPEVPDFWTQAGYLLMGTMLGAGALYWWWKLIRQRGRIASLRDGRMDVSGG